MTTIPVTHTDMDEPTPTVSGRLKAARAALILLPLFFIIVYGLSSWGMSKSAAVSQSNAAVEEVEAPPLTPEMRESVLASLPDDISEAQRDAALERVREAMRPREAGPQGRGQGRGNRGGGEDGGMLGIALLAFFAFTLLVAVFGVWTLLSSRAPRVVRGATFVVLPLMVLTGLATTGFALVAINEEPEEKRLSFNTLAVMADYARESDVVLSITTQGEVRPRTEIDLVP